ncbi:MAG: DUF3298 domain-containing protein [Rhizomicrobium sp.]
MPIRFISLYLAACLALAAGAASAAGLPLAKKTLAFRSKALDISVQYPQTGNKALDAVLADYARAQVADFKKFEPDLVAGEHPFTLDITYDVERNDRTMFGVLFTEFADTGGAHPNTDFAAFDFLLPSGEQVFLPEIVDGARGLKRVSDLAIAELVRTIGGPDSLTTKEDIASGAGPDALSLKYFLWLPTALHIHFPPYQVAAYAAGPQEVSIPLAALKGYIRPDWRAPQPSFDCKKAATPVEHALCSDLALSRLDRDVADLYRSKHASSDAGANDRLRQDQRDWLAARGKLCTGGALVPCLTKLYRGRLVALNKAPG